MYDPTQSLQCMMGKFSGIPTNIELAFLHSDGLYFLWHGINNSLVKQEFYGVGFITSFI